MAEGAVPGSTRHGQDGNPHTALYHESCGAKAKGLQAATEGSMTERELLAEIQPIEVDSEGAFEELPTVDIDDEGMWTALGDLDDLGVESQASPVCPNPTKWRLVGQARARGRFHQVSSAVSAKSAPVSHTFAVQRSVTFSAAVTAGIKVGLPVLEKEVGITLQASRTVTIGETLSYRVPKGSVMALFAGPGYIVRTFQRTVWGSAMCNKVVQTTEVSSPYTQILEVRNV